jgi:diadenylate cyclase
MKELVLGFRWQDGVDIFLLAIGIYSGINLIRGTRAVPMLIGLGMVYALYFLSAQFEIYTVNVLLNYVLGWSLVLFFIVFQNDIRRVLTQVGSGPLPTCVRTRRMSFWKTMKKRTSDQPRT